MSLFAELKRRKVFKVGGAYLVIAWLAVQVASIAFPAFEAPPWVLRVFILVLILGFPLALVLAWLLDATADGLKVEAARHGNERMTAIAVAFVALALAWYFVGHPAVREATAPRVAISSTAAPTSSVTAPEKSIAVLAFADMSLGKDNEYLGDGIAEEILNALAKVDGLKVAGRTSSFSFKGKDDDLRTIGQALSVAHVLEGSVRRQGEQVRITAQLIRTSDGFHLWSETFPGAMDDVFALQERIARAVTDELKIVLGTEQAQQLVDAGTQNAEAYALYLQASLIFHRRQGPRMREAEAMLSKAIALDPRFARAWARMASLRAIASNYSNLDPEKALDGVQEAAAKAIAIDPALAEPHAALALTLGSLRRYREERREFDQALALESDDVIANVWHGTSLARSGYRRQANAALDRTLTLDPLLPIALLWRGMGHVSDGELEIAQQQLRLADEGGLAFAGLGLGQVAAAHGKVEEAAGHFVRAFRALAADFPAETIEVFARACAGDASARAPAIALIDVHLEQNPALVPGIAVYVLLSVGESGRALALLGPKPTSNDPLVLGSLFRGVWPDALNSPRFPAFERETGLAALWDEVGAPDRCRKQGDDWVCSP